MHPSLMKCNQSDDQQARSQELTGYESAQRKRFLRSEQDELSTDKEQVA